MSKRFKCINDFCAEEFGSKKIRRLHEQSCFENFKKNTNRRTDAVKQVIKQVVVCNEIADSDGYNFTSYDDDDDNDNSDDEQDNHSDKSNDDNHAISSDDFFSSKKKIQMIINTMEKDIHQNLMLFFTNKITLASCAKIVNYSSNPSDPNAISLFIPSKFQTVGDNPTRRKYNQIKYALKDAGLVKTIKVQSGPYIHDSLPIYHNFLLTYRPLRSYLLSIIYDVSIWNIGTYQIKPIKQPNNTFCASYASSPNYAAWYEKIIAKFGDDGKFFLSNC